MIGKPSSPVRREAARKRTSPTAGTSLRGRPIRLTQNFRRLRIHTERRTDVHQAILSLACSAICLRKLILN